jgi:ferredoxin/flavodoxin---NADP+ reductase
LKVAVVGAGPSGFYAAEALLQGDAEVSLIERLPAPFGLVRYGVAPDHPKLKQAIVTFEQLAANPNFHFFGHVAVDIDVLVSDLQTLFDAVIFTYGASVDRTMNIRGEELSGSHTATEFVGWYNGHPHYRDCVFDLSSKVAIIVGNGNVALDVARILAKTPGELVHTDIAAHALDALAQSRITDIHIIGRRSAAQAKFSPQELREFGTVSACRIANNDGLALNAASEVEAADKMNRNIRSNIDILKSFCLPASPSGRRHCHFHFLKAPAQLVGSNRVRGIDLAHMQLRGEPFDQSTVATGLVERLDCDLVFRAVGYRGLPVAGLPFDHRRGVIPTQDGRVVDDFGAIMPGLYAAGWIKRGPSGGVGTNRADSAAVVEFLLRDLQAVSSDRPGNGGLRNLLANRAIRPVTFAQWKQIDSAEVTAGARLGKPREKFTTVPGMLSVLEAAS